jgi:hypothetical protein
MKHCLLACLFFCVVQLFAQPLTKLPFVEENPSYSIWNEIYTVEKIEYQLSHIVVTFKVTHQNITTPTLYTPDSDNCWFLRDKKGRTYELLAICNVRMNGKLLHKHLQKTTSFQEDAKLKKNELTCELYFNRLPDEVEMVDLIEGAANEGSMNAYHAYKIKVRTYPKLKRPMAEQTKGIIQN